MADRYTKTVLTIIAAALVAITAQQFVPNAAAQYGACGSSRHDPCYVEAADLVRGVSVYVENWP